MDESLISRNAGPACLSPPPPARQLPTPTQFPRRARRSPPRRVLRSGLLSRLSGEARRASGADALAEKGAHNLRGYIIGARVDVAQHPEEADHDILLIPATRYFFEQYANL